MNNTSKFIVITLLVGTTFWNIHHLSKPVDVSQKLDPKITAQQFFGKIPYDISQEASKRNIALLSLNISNKNMTIDEFNKIDKKIRKNWKMVKKTKYDYIYCADQWNQIIVSSPVSKYGERDEDNIKRMNVDHWNILISWESFGIEECKIIKNS